MNNIRSIRLKQLHGRLTEIAGHVQRSQFSQAGSTSWRPSINAYRCVKCIRVCVDLAGVEHSLIEIQVEPRRLLIRGQRQPPEPVERETKAVQVIALEIDYGPFEREVPLQTEVEPACVTTEQSNGLLWILMPLRAQS
jgi:HSP20 family protein